MECLLCLRKKKSSALQPEKQSKLCELAVTHNCTDSRIPLSERQKFLLVKNWKGISREVTEAGTTMFVRMLSENSEYFKMFAFRNIADETKEKQMSDECLRAHGEAVMGVIGQTISSVSDTKKFFEILKEVAERHAYKEGFKPEMFWKMEDAFLFAVRNILDERYTENMDTIYKIIIQVILQYMEEECKREIQEKKSMKMNDY